jgi:hypothetical protein
MSVINPLAWQPGTATRLEALTASKPTYKRFRQAVRQPSAMRCAVEGSDDAGVWVFHHLDCFNGRCVRQARGAPRRTR